MEEATLIFMIVVGGILLGLACNALSTGVGEKADSAPSDVSSGEPSSAEAVPDSNAKDCKSCGGHSQAGSLCSFCGRAL